MSPLPQSADVLVVGGGPAGLSLGGELKRLGVSALVIDQQLEGENTSRAAVIHARTLEVLEPLGATAELIARGLKVAVFRVRDRDKVLLTIPFDGLATPFPFTLMCPQNQTEAVLIERLRALGGEVIRPARLLSVQSTESGVEAIVDCAGEHKTVAARWVVGCDGAHSVVRDQAGIAFEGATYPQDFILADVRMDWSLRQDRGQPVLFAGRSRSGRAAARRGLPRRGLGGRRPGVSVRRRCPGLARQPRPAG